MSRARLKKEAQARALRFEKGARLRRIAALPPAVRAYIEGARPWFGVDLELVERICELLAPPAELFTPDGAAVLEGVEVSGDVLSRAIAAGTIPSIPVYGTSGTRVCHAITEAAARSVKRKRARAGEARAAAPIPSRENPPAKATRKRPPRASTAPE